MKVHLPALPKPLHFTRSNVLFSLFKELILTKLENLLSYTNINNRICPIPHKWNELWKLLPNRTRVGSGWEPPLPLILAAWNFTEDYEKRARLVEHIKWAEKHGQIELASNFLRGLQEDEWHHSEE